jgi:peptidoglycan/LPS O-acetylase OafA/YrhL
MPALTALTALRFFAAFYVVLFHAFPWQQLQAGDTSTWAQVWARFCSHGFAAVGFFFALSGFILAYNYPASRPTAPRDFYRARFARVYPVYLLALGLGLPFLLVRTMRAGSWGQAALEVVMALTLLQAWVPSLWNAVNPPGWSLSVEAFFYLVFPNLSRRLASWTSSRARGAMVLVGLFALAVGPALIGTLASETGLPRTDESNLANFVRYWPLLALPEFAFGVVLGHMRVQGLAGAVWSRRLFVPALLLLAVVLSSDVVPDMLLHNGVLLPLFAVVILRCADATGAPRLLRLPALHALGEASYSLYLLHLLLWIAVKIVLERSGLDPTAPWVFPAYALLACAASLASHRWLEEPARLRLRSPRRTVTG